MNVLLEWYTIEKAVTVLGVSVLFLAVATLLHVRQKGGSVHSRSKR